MVLIEKKEKINTYVLVSCILSAALIISFAIASQTFYSVSKFGDTISTTGSAKIKVQSDSAKWSISISKNVFESGVKAGYKELSVNTEKLLNILKKNGIKAENIKLEPVALEEQYAYGNDRPKEKEYKINQYIKIESNNQAEIKNLTNIAKEVSGLIEEGVNIITNNISYYYNKIDEARISLMALAVKDAKARADAIVNNTGSKVGTLKSASNGVVQVLAPNSIDISDYGTYDTSSIDKEIMVTVRTTFSLK